MLYAHTFPRQTRLGVEEQGYGGAVLARDDVERFAVGVGERDRGGLFANEFFVGHCGNIMVEVEWEERIYRLQGLDSASILGSY